MKVFGVVEVTYGHHPVVAVFLDEKKAERHAKKLKKINDAANKLYFDWKEDKDEKFDLFLNGREYCYELYSEFEDSWDWSNTPECVASYDYHVEAYEVLDAGS